MRADRFQIYGEGAWNPEMLSLPCCSAQIPGQRGRLIPPPQVNGTSHPPASSQHELNSVTMTYIRAVELADSIKTMVACAMDASAERVDQSRGSEGSERFLSS